MMHGDPQLESRLAAIEREQARMPLLPPGGGGGGVDYLRLIVGAGNTIEGATYGSPVGLQGLDPATDTPITAVPTAIPTLSDFNGGTFTDGLATARIPGGTYVWIASYVQLNGTDDHFDSPFSIAKGQSLACQLSTAVQVPITGGGGATATVYLPWQAI